MKTRFQIFPINNTVYFIISIYVNFNLFKFYLLFQLFILLPKGRSYEVGFKVGSRGVVIVTTGVEPFGFDHSPFRRTDLKPTRFEVVSDQPPLVSHSENLWSRANFDLYYFNKSYIFNIPSHYSRLSFREPLGGIIWVSHNCNKWCCRSLKYFCNSFDFKRSLIRSHAHQN